MFTHKRKPSMCKLCEIIGDILPRGKTVTNVLPGMLVVTPSKIRLHVQFCHQIVHLTSPLKVFADLGALASYPREDLTDSK
jgi:hypothetical protein